VKTHRINKIKNKSPL